MHHVDAAAILQRLLEQSPAKSRERYGYQAEQLGQDCAHLGLGYREHVFSEPWMQARYAIGYEEATIKAKLGEVTLSPAEVWSLQEEA